MNEPGNSEVTDQSRAIELDGGLGTQREHWEELNSGMHDSSSAFLLFLLTVSLI